MKRKLLIAEDNVFTANQYKIFLEKNGYEVTVCNNGVACLNKFNREFKYKHVVLKEKSAPYDYILLDKLCPKQKICFLSAYGQNIIQKYTLNRDGALQILQKPFSLEFLLKKLEPKTFSIVKRRSENNVLTTTQSSESIR